MISKEDGFEDGKQIQCSTRKSQRYLNFFCFPTLVALFGMDGMDDDRAPHFIQSDDDDDVSTSTDGKQLDRACAHAHMYHG